MQIYKATVYTFNSTCKFMVLLIYLLAFQALPYKVVTPVAVEILYLSPNIEEIYKVLQILYLYSSFYALYVICYNKVYIHESSFIQMNC